VVQGRREEGMGDLLEDGEVVPPGEGVGEGHGEEGMI